MVAYPEEDAQILFETIMIAAAFIIGALATFLITGITVKDSDPTSYIIITMLMGVLFIFFTMKDRTSLSKGTYDVPAGILIFLAYVIMVAFARGSLSYEFLTFRIDALLLPLLLLAIVVTIADTKGALRFAPVFGYLLFASPVVLLPILSLNSSLANFTAGIVASFMKMLGVNVVQSGLSIIAPSGSTIQIALTCVPIGTFIAFIMLLFPVAYLYKGRVSHKLTWIACGLGLLFALNILRMIIISFAWATSGIGAAIASFHAIGGTFIFYISIIAMLLLYNKFNLSLNLGKKLIKRIKAAFSIYDIEADYPRIAIALLIGIASLFISIGYIHSINASAPLFNSTTLNTNASRLALYNNVFSRLNASKIPYYYLGSSGAGTMLFELGNTPSAVNSTYLLVSFYPFTERGGNLLNYSNTTSKSTLITNSGITVTSLIAYTSSSQFYINYFAIPVKLQNSYVSANFEIFSKAGIPEAKYCNPADYSNLAPYFESSIYNLLTGGPAQPQGLRL